VRKLRTLSLSARTDDKPGTGGRTEENFKVRQAQSPVAARLKIQPSKIKKRRGMCSAPFLFPNSSVTAVTAFFQRHFSPGLAD
jgi:hypothetical protein